jgi:hypothetical protein
VLETPSSSLLPLLLLLRRLVRLYVSVATVQPALLQLLHLEMLVVAGLVVVTRVVVVVRAIVWAVHVASI